ncbi:MAG TPA: class I SAM-dependent methyltransferase [Gaiellaceae bacterium]|nr:class I SAM-dependent methyltransferase [Gaiellaceae bacterium]
MSRDLDLLVREVQRLTSEIEQLRGRVEAYERSRWMRMHPGLLLRRMRARRRDASLDAVGAAAPPSERPDDPLVARFRKEVLERGAFTHDWFTHQIVPWEPLLQELERRPSRLLEIGSFEGLSACYMLWRLPDAQVTCVDTFEGSVEYAVIDVDVSALQDVFAANIALVDATRVRTFAGDSRRVLVDLIAGGERFDLVYIDGSHLGLDVLVDTALSWQLLEDGGFLVFDDYHWKGVGEDPLLRPGPAVDAFLAFVDGKYELLRKDVQVAVRKTG